MSPGLGKKRQQETEKTEDTASTGSHDVPSSDVLRGPQGVDDDSDVHLLTSPRVENDDISKVTEARKVQPRSELHDIVNENFSKCIQQINQRNASRSAVSKSTGTEHLQGLIAENHVHSHKDFNGNSTPVEQNGRAVKSTEQSSKSTTIKASNRHTEYEDVAPSSQCDANGNSCCVIPPPPSADADAVAALAPVGPRRGVAQYGREEWRGDTQRATVMRQGYAATPSAVGAAALRVVRGDNYCAVRAAVFQALVAGRQLPSAAAAMAVVREAAGGNKSWLSKWTFAGRLQFDDVLSGMETCLMTLETLSRSLASAPDPEEALTLRLNSSPRVDLQVCEAVKLLMLAEAIRLYGRQRGGDELPLFAVILFARESSRSLEAFVANHLNTVGDCGGLEQVDMFLLGHALGCLLRVVRPSCWGAEDFLCCYPDQAWPDPTQPWPELALMAEDDRHYNVLL